MKTYTFYWLTGDRETSQGLDIADAFRRAGYGGGAIAALDFHAEGDDRDYEWNPETRKWERI
jgi:hypothetical protein